MNEKEGSEGGRDYMITWRRGQRSQASVQCVGSRIQTIQAKRQREVLKYSVRPTKSIPEATLTHGRGREGDVM